MSEPVAKAAPLKPDELVARYVGGIHIDGGTDQINGSAFDRTHKDVDGLSFTRRGVFAVDVQPDREAIRQAVGSRLRLGKTAVFVELQVGGALEALKGYDSEFEFIEDPLEAEGDALANAAHALLVGYPFKDEAVGSLKSEVAGDQLRLRILDRFRAVIS
jgi:hypothetical protein